VSSRADILLAVSTSIDRTAEPGSRGALPKAIGWFVFASRWLQAPLYLGLIIAQAFYVVVFMIELWHLGESVIGAVMHPEATELEDAVSLEATVMLAVLGLIDVVMIANLLIMVIIGGYETFVSRINVDGHPDQPEWLSHVNANVLKVKLAMAIIGISSIHLLKTFIGVAGLGGPHDDGEFTWDGVLWQVVIHLTFIVSAVALALIDKWSLQHQTSVRHAARHEGSETVAA